MVFCDDAVEDLDRCASVTFDLLLINRFPHGTVNKPARHGVPETPLLFYRMELTNIQLVPT